MGRRVKGILFAEYVRMIRGNKQYDWTSQLLPEDLPFVAQKVDLSGWYPMETFERLGNAILKFVALDQLEAVRMWGRFSVDELRAAQPELLVVGDPVETLQRFRVLRATYFDFPALEIIMLLDDAVDIVISYHMGARAEEAASMQTMGFFEPRAGRRRERQRQAVAALVGGRSAHALASELGPTAATTVTYTAGARKEAPCALRSLPSSSSPWSYRPPRTPSPSTKSYRRRSPRRAAPTSCAPSARCG